MRMMTGVECTASIMFCETIPRILFFSVSSSFLPPPPPPHTHTPLGPLNISLMLSEFTNTLLANMDQIWAELGRIMLFNKRGRARVLKVHGSTTICYCCYIR